jgi:hypothetical protein
VGAQGGRMKRRSSSLFRDVLRERGFLRDGTWSSAWVERKLTKAEKAECYRLWVKHADIRLGRVSA